MLITIVQTADAVMAHAPTLIMAVQILTLVITILQPIKMMVLAMAPVVVPIHLIATTTLLPHATMARAQAHPAAPIQRLATIILRQVAMMVPVSEL